MRIEIFTVGEVVLEEAETSIDYRRGGGQTRANFPLQAEG